MADLSKVADLSWFRLGQRSRTPNATRSPTSSERAPPRDRESQQMGTDHRRPGPSRVPSYLSLASRASFSPEPLPGGSETSLLVRDQDKIWYNPSLDQMVEVLQVNIMTQGILEPIPVQYNTYVLHLIEGFADSQDKIRTADAACAEAKQSLEQILEQCRLVADDWMEREKQYKAEIKRLEVLLSRTSQDGLEAVTLARTNSVVDRAGPGARHFLSRLKRLGKNVTEGSSSSSSSSATWITDQLQPQGTTMDREYLDRDKASPDNQRPTPLPKILDSTNDFLMSERFRRTDAVARASATDLRGRRQGRPREATRSPRSDSTTMDKTVAPRPGQASVGTTRPLFCDDIPRPAGDGGSPEVYLDSSVSGKKHVRQQVLEKLLGSETDDSRGGDSNRPKRQAHQPASHGGASDAPHGHTMSEHDGRHQRDYRHQRGLSGFSFAEGDDIFPPLADRAGQDEEDEVASEGIEMRRYEQIPRRRTDAGQQSSPENRGGVDDSTSSSHTALRGEQGQPGMTSQDSLGSTASTASSRRTVMRISSPSQGSPGPDSGWGQGSVAGRDAAGKQQADKDVSRIAAARAVARNSSREQGNRG
ncbi:Uu.00g091740.m01.CDS01 [Anthostomella pinea]|uniref:Uu.00g091740.m01.CDS01 n=1 Tax=Anthostomella pinea TaxID=933095 RepID=A0AAI8VHP5_9PEZI|nr:Uu.00g091740.m01.CDS01 [Anthostomella pinea]